MNIDNTHYNKIYNHQIELLDCLQGIFEDLQGTSNKNINETRETKRSISPISTPLSEPSFSNWKQRNKTFLDELKLNNNESCEKNRVKSYMNTKMSDKTTQEINEFRRRKKEEEEEELTLKPQINKQSEKLNRSIDDLVRWNENKEEKLNKRRKERENNEINQYNFQSSKSSKKMLKNRKNIPIEDKLLSDKELYDKHKKELLQMYTPSYKPHINHTRSSSSSLLLRSSSSNSYNNNNNSNLDFKQRLTIAANMSNKNENIKTKSAPTTPTNKPLKLVLKKKKNISSVSTIIDNEEGYGWINNVLNSEKIETRKSLNNNELIKNSIWYEYKSDKGYPYYYNPKSGETVWQAPKNAKIQVMFD